MLTSMVAVDNIANSISSKDNIWSVNTEEEYREVNVRTEKTKMFTDRKSV